MFDSRLAIWTYEWPNDYPAVEEFSTTGLIAKMAECSRWGRSTELAAGSEQSAADMPRAALAMSGSLVDVGSMDGRAIAKQDDETAEHPGEDLCFQI